MKIGDLVTHKVLGFGVVVECKMDPNWAASNQDYPVCLVYWASQRNTMWINRSKIELVNENR
jgi:heat shock protein HspQ